MNLTPEEGSRWQSSNGTWYIFRKTTSEGEYQFTSERIGQLFVYPPSQFWASFDHERNASKIKRLPDRPHEELWVEYEAALIEHVANRNFVQVLRETAEQAYDAWLLADATFREANRTDTSRLTQAQYALDTAYGLKPEKPYRRG